MLSGFVSPDSVVTDLFFDCSKNSIKYEYSRLRIDWSIYLAEFCGLLSPQQRIRVSGICGGSVREGCAYWQVTV